MKLFLAGTDDVNKLKAVFVSKHPYILSSYLYSFYDCSVKAHLRWKEQYDFGKARGAEWIMDSGLFSMMFGAQKDRTFTEKELLVYTNDYIAKMKEIGYTDTIVEMDVHKILGLDSLKKFRKIFETEYDVEKTIFVWHIEEEIRGWEKLVARYPYIALSIPELRKVLSDVKMKHFIRSMLRKAHRVNKNVRVHLLGCTEQGLLQQSGYYSSDSSSWLYSQTFGKPSEYHHGRMMQRLISDKEMLRLFESRREDIESRLAAVGMILNTENRKKYWGFSVTSAEAYHKLNKYINAHFYNGERVPQITI